MTVTVPEVVATMPPSTRAPVPALVMLKVAPLATLPLIVSVLPLTVMVRLALPSERLPVVEVRLAVPVNTRLAPRVIPLLIVTFVEASRTPPLTVRVPPPRALLEPITSVPAARVVPPE